MQKIISGQGIMSRRAAETAIEQGRVRINGKTIKQLGTKADPLNDDIRVDNRPIRRKGPAPVYAFNKPREVVTTKNDPQGRRTIQHYLPARVKANPVGRLDFHSEGLLVLTSDGDLSFRLSHPSHKVAKVYLAKVKGRPLEKTYLKLRKGVSLKDGRGKFESVLIKRKMENKTVLRVVVNEGRNRFVRRMLQQVGHPVDRLKRIQIGPLKMGTLRPGQYRQLSAAEVRALRKSVGLTRD